jgi:hypothetical protein
MPSSTAQPSDGESQVVKDFKQWLQANDKGQAVAVGAINALTNLVKRSDASTIMELEIVLKDAQEQLQKVMRPLDPRDFNGINFKTF